MMKMMVLCFVGDSQTAHEAWFPFFLFADMLSDMKSV
jgi:hypothetical protein